MSSTSFAACRPDYARRWSSMRIRTANQPAVQQAVRRIVSGRSRYEVVEGVSGVPWWLIGALHERESGCDFRGVLHNGEKILGTGRKTRSQPKGRGPFSTWEESARDALAIKGLRPGSRVWTMERCLYEAERFNGFGYRQYRGIASPYLWSGTDQYSRGKYVDDSEWSASAVDKQLGVAPLIKVLMDYVPEARFARGEPAAAESPAGAGDLSRGEVWAIQQRLRDLGYHEVGRVDGLWAPRRWARW